MPNKSIKPNAHYPILTCIPKSLPANRLVEAARVAAQINPRHAAHLDTLLDAKRGAKSVLDIQRIGARTTKFWGAKGVHLTVGFLDNPETALKKRILAHMNAWSETANVSFTESGPTAQVRIGRYKGSQGGYWSYLGTDILSIAPGEPTMNLEGFTMLTPESEFHRVVRHETGHTLGFPHEHMRGALVNLIDKPKAIAYFRRTQGWTSAEVNAQVLTPIEESSLLNPTKPDPHSIMCYQIPGEITKNGEPIPGGDDIDTLDASYAGNIYPKSLKPSKSASKFPRPKTFHSSLNPLDRTR